MIQSVILKMEGIGIVMVAIGLLTIVANVIVNFNYVKHLLSDKPTLLFLLLIVYSFLNWIIKNPGYSGTDFLQFISGQFTSPLIFFIIVKMMLSYDSTRCERVLLLSLLTFCLISVFFFQESEQEAGRKTVEGVGNILPLCGVTAIWLCLFMRLQRKIERPQAFFFIMLLIIVLFVCASRKAIGAAVILFLGYYFAVSRGNPLRAFIYGSISALALYFVSDYLMHSLVVSRIVETSESSIVEVTSNPVIDKLLLPILGDRAQQYSEAFIIIPNYLWTGIGLRNFADYSMLEVPFHTEYMVQLCENGLIGFVLFILFYYYVLRDILKNKSNQLYFFSIFVFISLLFLNLTTWMYNTTYGMIYYAFLTSLPKITSFNK